MAINHYKIKLKTLSPIHIGSGEQVSKTEVLIDNIKKIVYIPDNSKLFHGMIECGIAEKYEKEIMSNTSFDLLDFLRRCGVPEEKYLSWVRYSYSLGEINDKKMNIDTFYKDAYSRPYVPGSSLKGALRTALLANAFLNNSKLTIDKSSEKRNGYKIGDMKKHESDTEVKLFHTLDNKRDKKANAVNSIFKGLRISDSEPVDLENIILCQKIDIKAEPYRQSKFYKEKNAINVYRECIKPGTEIVFDTIIDTEYFKYSAKDILKAASNYFDSQYEQFLSYINNKAPTLPQENNIIYIGGGTGFASKTVTYQMFNDPEKAVHAVQDIMSSNFRNHNHKNDVNNYNVSPRMRKCTRYNNRLYDMGLCSILFEKV